MKYVISRVLGSRKRRSSHFQQDYMLFDFMKHQLLDTESSSCRTKTISTMLSPSGIEHQLCFRKLSSACRTVLLCFGHLSVCLFLMLLNGPSIPHSLGTPYCLPLHCLSDHAPSLLSATGVTSLKPFCWAAWNQFNPILLLPFPLLKPDDILNQITPKTDPFTRPWKVSINDSQTFRSSSISPTLPTAQNLVWESNYRLFQFKSFNKLTANCIFNCSFVYPIGENMILHVKFSFYLCLCRYFWEDGNTCLSESLWALHYFK